MASCLPQCYPRCRALAIRQLTEFERRQLAAIRKELDQEYEAAVGLTAQPSKGGAEAKILSDLNRYYCHKIFQRLIGTSVKHQE